MEPGLHAHLDRWLRAGREAWPGIALAPEALAAHLARLGIDPAAAHAHEADLVLACACSLGNAAALAAFEGAFAGTARAAAARIDRASDFVDEVVQRARARMLVAESGAPPRIAEYAGAGSLHGWVQVATMRVAMNLRREQRRDALIDDEAFFDVALEATDPDRRRHRALYTETCAEALREAFGVLSTRERNLLRLHHLDGLTVDDLAPTFRVHRATVARWLARARERLLEEMRARVRARLGIGASTADGILADVESWIDLSVTRLLAERDG